VLITSGTPSYCECSMKEVLCQLVSCLYLLRNDAGHLFRLSLWYCGDVPDLGRFFMEDFRRTMFRVIETGKTVELSRC